MYYKLYIDSVFFMQLVMNIYLLSITGKVLKCTATHRRIFLGALSGAGMICLVILFPLGDLKSRLFCGLLPVSMCMMRMVFRISTFGNLLKSSLFLGSCGFFLGSIVLWIRNHFPMAKQWRYSIWFLFLAGYAGYQVLRLVLHRMACLRENELKEVWIPNKAQPVHLKALVDTGNHLTEPISGAPVCLISEKTAALLEEYFLPEHFHAIPYQSVGKKRGILTAYELPELVIKEPYREIHKEKVIFAICNAGISKDSIYQMILHPQLLDD